MGYTGKYDFCGWASKNDLLCEDGRIIRHGAFQIDGLKKVPLVWNHEHNDPSKVLGHAWLEPREEGIYAYGVFNDTQKGQDAKAALKHGDVDAMSVWANNLVQTGSDVLHGVIREVSLVLAGANPGAFVESVMAHGIAMDEDEEEGIFYTGDSIFLEHSVDKKEEDKEMDAENKKEDPEQKTEKEPEKETEESGKTVKDIYNAMTDDQKKVVAIISNEMVKAATKSKNSDEDEDEEDKEMKHNVFEGQQATSNVISHDAMKSIFADAKKCGSLKEAVNNAMSEGGVLAHSLDTTGMITATRTQTYGFNDPSMLFPDYKTLNNPPEFISREMDWVQKVMAGVHHTPFSRIKSVFANITEDEARAKGYIKGNQKKTEVFSTLKRTTDPQTIYKLQKMDRDDILDITDFDVVAWIKSEMRVMLDEEIARAILIGDGREADAEDKIQEAHVRPIAKDVPLFNISYRVKTKTGATDADKAKAAIDGAVRARKAYKGSGNPTLWTTEDFLTEALLLEDGIGHKLYKSTAELATAMRVSDIVTVEPMEGLEINGLPLIGVIVNLKDYNVGADKGGEVNMFDDFDLDYNKYEYLIETRISGALVKPFSAITLLEAAE